MRIIKDNILDMERGVLINGVNCQRAMGSGIAKAYYTKWPQVREQYMSLDKSEMRTCKMQMVEIEPNELYVANCFTQEFYGNDGEVYAKPMAIFFSVSAAVTFAQSRSLPVYSPWVGCGLGGLDRNEVEAVLTDVENLTNYKITVIELEGE